MKIFFYTSGCRVNQYETQYMKEAICRNGAYKITDNPAGADIAVINSCTVTHGADADCRQVMRRVMRKNPGCRLIITGCYAAASKKAIKDICPSAEVLPVKEDVIKNINRSSSVFGGITYFEGHLKAFLKIQDGCDAFCSYCVVPLVRNRIYSKPADDIFNEIEGLLDNGYSEIVLCGIRLGKYGAGSNGDSNLVSLLKALLKKYPSLKVGLSSIELLDISESLAGLIAGSKNIIKRLHIPLQSGDDKVLKMMNRPYTSGQYLKKIKRLKEKIPGLKLTTDVIVGFPGETPENFENTAEFVKKCGFSGLHVFRFSPRPGTAAEKMPGKCNSQELKSRSSILKNGNGDASHY